METLSALLSPCEMDPPIIPSLKISNADLQLPVIWDGMKLV